MLEINKAKLQIKSWCNAPESGAIDQLVNLANHPMAVGHIVALPDVHVGCGMPIGSVIALDNAISPNMVGSDIACGMMAVKTNLYREEISNEALKKIVHQIKRDVPMGFNKQKDDKWKSEATSLVSEYIDICDAKKIPVSSNMELSNVYIQLGTLGGGNHFIEIQYDENDHVWFMLHSGSRNIGKCIGDEFDAYAKKFCEEDRVQLPTQELAHLSLSTLEGQAYLANMNFCVEFSFKNRECMAKDIKYAFERTLGKAIEFVEMRNIHHNFAALENHFGQDVWVHRKGATSAKENQIGIIPGAMSQQSFIVSGLGNIESMQSCSHGAGRRMSRKQAKKTITMDEFKEEMQGIVSEDINPEHLDECGKAYKDIDVCMAEQTDLVKIVHTLTPLANCKG